MIGSKGSIERSCVAPRDDRFNGYAVVVGCCVQEGLVELPAVAHQSPGADQRQGVHVATGADETSPSSRGEPSCMHLAWNWHPPSLS